MTRRDWSDSHAEKFSAGMLVDAWDRSPRTRQGRKVATIRITREPYLEDVKYTPLDAWDREGFAWLRAHGTDDDRARVRQIWREWHDASQWLYVVEFELVSVVGR